MNWENIGSFRFRNDLNALYDYRERSLGFIAKRGEAAIKKGMKVIIDKIMPKSDGDIHLEVFLAQHERMQRFIKNPPDFAMIVYPYKGEVEKYELTKKNFLTNVHQDPDPLVVQDIEQRIYLHPTVTDNPFWLPGKKWVPNIITGAVFFKKNPFRNYESYPGFQEFFEECIDKKRY